MPTLDADKEEIKNILNENYRTYYESKFGFLKEHNGLRPGSIHLFLGSTGTGKSTLVRSILLDFIKLNDDRVHLHLSEESRKDLLTEINKCEINDYRHKLSNVVFTSEQEAPEMVDGDEGQQWIWLSETCRGFKCKLLIIDNITTSWFYLDRRVKDQSDFSKKLKKFAQDNGVAVVVIAHTGAAISDNMNRFVNENDIRGSKSIVNMCQFLYIIQRFEHEMGGEKKYIPTLRIIKHRGQSIEKSIFLLDFVKYRNIFVRDIPMTFKDFLSSFQSRNRLVEKSPYSDGKKKENKND